MSASSSSFSMGGLRGSGGTNNYGTTLNSDSDADFHRTSVGEDTLGRHYSLSHSWVLESLLSDRPLPIVILTATTAQITRETGQCYPLETYRFDPRVETWMVIVNASSAAPSPVVSRTTTLSRSSSSSSQSLLLDGPSIRLYWKFQSAHGYTDSKEFLRRLIQPSDDCWRVIEHLADDMITVQVGEDQLLPLSCVREMLAKYRLAVRSAMSSRRNSNCSSDDDGLRLVHSAPPIIGDEDFDRRRRDSLLVTRRSSIGVIHSPSSSASAAGGCGNNSFPPVARLQQQMDAIAAAAATADHHEQRETQVIVDMLTELTHY